MGFNYRKERRKFEKQMEENERKYRDAGMSESQIRAMREYEEEMFRKERVHGIHIVLEESKEYLGLIERAESYDIYFQDMRISLDNILDNIHPGVSKRLSAQDKTILSYIAAGYNHRETASKLGITQQQLDSVRKRLLALHEKQERCSRESRELYETFAMGSLNRVDYLVQKSALTEKKTEIAQQISELQKVLDSQNEKSSDQFVDIFKPFWDVKDIPDEAFKDLLKEVKVFPGNRLAVVWNCQDALAVKSDGTP